MKREIICKSCKPRLENTYGKTTVLHPEEHFKFAEGKLFAACFCDYCNKELSAGETVFASSLWSDYERHGYYEWENEFIMINQQERIELRKEGNNA